MYFTLKDDKTESATAAETETISYDVLTQVRVGYMPNYDSLWAVATAINKGYFEEQGLDIKLSSFQVDEAGIGLMASGSVDVAYIGADVHKRCIEGAAQIFCSSLKVSGETVDCQGWVCLPGYVDWRGLARGTSRPPPLLSCRSPSSRSRRRSRVADCTPPDDDCPPVSVGTGGKLAVV